VTPLPAERVLDQFFLEARGKLLELAAVLDRFGRGDGADASSTDHRAAKLKHAIEVLLTSAPNKAELLQQLFSLSYDPEWKRPAPR
jgi:hypothetical protein